MKRAPRRRALPSRTACLALAALLGAASLGGCLRDDDWDPADITSVFDGDGGPELGPRTTAAPYAGANSFLLDAQANFPTGLELQSEVIRRSCGPLNGVCHNQKEYPDLHTPANFIASIAADCNVQPGTHTAVFDRCERTGDIVEVADQQAEIGWVEYIPRPSDYDDENVVVEPTMPGLHLHFEAAFDPANIEGRWQTMSFSRRFVDGTGSASSLGYATFTNFWHSFDGGTHLVVEVPGYRIGDLESLLATGVEQGDLNRNGVFGQQAASSGHVSMMEPGHPERSYLIGRMFSEMEGEDVPGSRMPLANLPLSVSEMLALFCFIEGLDPAASAYNIESDIDYNACSFATNTGAISELELEGTGSGWADRISPLLEANCGGCHDGNTPSTGVTLVGAGVYTELITPFPPGDSRPGTAYIVPNDPANSYLWLKLADDPSIPGEAMPYSPGAAFSPLAAGELADIQAWINAGAPEVTP